LAAPIVNIDAGIADVLRLVKEILARRAQRKRQVVEDILDDVEAAVAVVNGLEELYMEILNQFASRRVVEDENALADLVAQADTFLYKRKLLTIFDERLPAIRAARDDTKVEKRLREPFLENVSDALDAYRNSLERDTSPVTEPGQLAKVHSLAYSRVNGGDVPPSLIREEADATRRRHDASLSENVLAASGSLRHAART